MVKTRARIFGILLCLTILFSVIPAQAVADTTEFVSREEAVVSLLGTIGLDALDATRSDLSVFADADQISSQFMDEMAIAVTNGLLPGITGNALNPQLTITRLEFALIISNAMRELPVIKAVPAFTDVPAEVISKVNRIAGAGLMSGYGNGFFGSDDYLTVEQMGIVLNNIRVLSEVRPQDDFYYFVNREWLAGTRLPAGYPGMTTFDEVDRSNTSKLKTLAQELLKHQGTYPEGSVEQKLTDFYDTILDMENRNKEGIQPIKKYLDLINNSQSVQELLDLMVQIETETGMNPLFSFSPSADLIDSNHYSLYGSGLSTGLPADYMLADYPEIKALYEGLITQLLMLSGVPMDEAGTEAQNLYDFEKIIAESTLSNEEASKVENVYNPVSREDLVQLFPSVKIGEYLKDLGYGPVEEIILTDKNLMKKTGELLADENLDVLKTYSHFRIITNTASLLSKDFRDVITGFNNAFYGISTSIDDDDVAFNLLNSVMSDYLGKMYVEQYFSAEAKADVESIVADIIATYQGRIEKLDWMSRETKEKAITKLNTIKVKIGYPDKWADPLADISIKTYEDGGSLLGNIFAMTSASVKESKALLSKPVDKSKWFIPAHTVNAYYSATNNEIVFPAGILQTPFYDLEATREQNLGGIGTIIAHEITHAFDNNGAKFDENGNLNDWWTQDDSTAFEQKCQAIVALYHGLVIAPNATVNGNLTVSENVADIGAMACILDITGNIPDADYRALFESNAKIWRFTGTEQMYQVLATQDVHSPNKYRVNRVLQNFQEFYDAYHIKSEDVMYLAPEDRVTIW